MPIVCDLNLFYFHIPRCAGTSLENFFGTIGRDSFHGVVTEGHEHITLHHLTPRELISRGYLNRSELSSFYLFAIIRDPFERLFSDYCWQIKHDIHDLFAKMSFSAYLEFAENIIRDNRYFEQTHFDHFRPMIEYCYLDKDMILDDILLLENVGRELRRLPGFEKNVRFPHVNSFRNPRIMEEASQLRERVYDIYQDDLELYQSVKVSRRRPGRISR